MKLFYEHKLNNRFGFIIYLGVLMSSINFIHAQIPKDFNTQRIRAERATNNHANYLTKILNDPKILESYNTIDKETFTNVPVQLSIINNQWEKYGYGLYILFDIKTSEFLGFAGYHSVELDEADKLNDVVINKSANELEIYLFFMANHLLKEYEFEIANELVNLAFKHLPYLSIIAYVQPADTATVNLFKKLNFKEEKIIVYNNKSHVLLRLKKNSVFK